MALKNLLANKKKLEIKNIEIEMHKKLQIKNRN